LRLRPIPHLPPGSGWQHSRLKAAEGSKRGLGRNFWSGNHVLVAELQRPAEACLSRPSLVHPIVRTSRPAPSLECSRRPPILTQIASVVFICATTTCPTTRPDPSSSRPISTGGWLQRARHSVPLIPNSCFRLASRVGPRLKLSRLTACHQSRPRRKGRLHLTMSTCCILRCHFTALSQG
jgi:hypothetical protein